MEYASFCQLTGNSAQLERLPMDVSSRRDFSHKSGCQALLDMGASRSVISLGLANKLKCELDTSGGITLSNASGHKMEVAGECHVWVLISNWKYRVKCIVTNSLEGEDLVLGLSELKRTNLLPK